MRLKLTLEYNKWYESLRPKEKAQIAKRLYNIEEYGHFGLVKDLGDFLMELKWINGRRIYYSILQDQNGELTLLVLGGNKNGQDTDIKVAKKILKRYIKS